MSLIWSPPNATVYTEVSGTFTFTDDDVRAVYIDWDDGPSNKKSEANYQWWTTTEPTTSAVLTHTYTATGTYNPIVQVINDRGMASKYHSARDPVTTEVSPSVKDTGITPITIADGTATGLLRTENRTVLSGIDNAIFEKSGSRDLYVAIAPTMSLTSLESIASGTGLEITVKAVVEDYVDDAAGAATKDGLVVVRDIDVKVPSTTWAAAQGGLKVNDSSFTIKKVVKATLKTCKPLLSSSATHTTNNDLNKLKLFLFTSGSSTEAGYIYPVTYLSFGCPVKRLADTDRSVLMDFTQSRAKASNTIISEYFFDLGKSWFNPQDIWAVEGFGPHPDYSTPSAFTSGTATSGTTKRVYYTYMPRPDGLLSAVTGAIGAPTGRYQQALNLNTTVTGCSSWYIIDDIADDRSDQFLIDDFGRLSPQYHLMRLEANPNSSNNRSTLDGFAGVYRITPPPNWGASGAGGPHTGAGTPTPVPGSAQVMASGGSAAKFYQSSPTENDTVFTNTTTSGTYINCTAVGQASGTNRILRLSGMNIDMVDYGTGTTAGFEYTNVSGTARQAHEYYIAISPRKTNKIFFNASPLAKTFTSKMGSASGNSTQILGVYYLKVNNKATFSQTCEWVPLEFEDTTKVEQEYKDTSGEKYITRTASLAKNGYLSFDMPEDWSKISMSGLTGGTPVGVSERSAFIDRIDSRPVDPRYELELGNAMAPLQISATGGLFGTGKHGRFVTITGANIGSQLSSSGYTSDDIGAYKYMAIIISSSASNYIHHNHVSPHFGVDFSGNQAGFAFWVASGASNGYDGGDAITLQVGHGNNIGATWTSGNMGYDWSAANTRESPGYGPFMNYGMWKAGDDVHLKIRNLGIYDVFDGASKVYVSLTGAAYNSTYTAVNAADEKAWDNTYGFEDNTNGIAVEASGTWGSTEYYPLKIVLSGTDFSAFAHNTQYINRGVIVGAVSPASQSSGVELWNMLPADNAFSQIIKEEDDSAFNLTRLPLTSDVSVGRAGNFYEAITRKGKVIIVQTGISIQNISFSSVALGDESDANAFATYSAEGTLYDYLHKIRRIEEENVPVFWDEKQKDATYVRFWGIVKSVEETSGTGGPRKVRNFGFTMTVQKVALIDANGKLMADPTPLGGIRDARDYT